MIRARRGLSTRRRESKRTGRRAPHAPSQPRPQRHEEITVARHRDSHRRFAAIIAQSVADFERHGFLIRAAAADRAGIFAAMTRIDRDSDHRCTSAGLTRCWTLNYSRRLDWCAAPPVRAAMRATVRWIDRIQIHHQTCWYGPIGSSENTCGLMSSFSSITSRATFGRFGRPAPEQCTGRSLRSCRPAPSKSASDRARLFRLPVARGCAGSRTMKCERSTARRARA